MAYYKIVLSGRAEKELRKIDATARKRLTVAIDKLAEEPRPLAAKKLVGYDGFRLRVGDYRILYEISDEIVTIFIIKIGHRREIYKSR